jgi:hypothetical protein
MKGEKKKLRIEWPTLSLVGREHADKPCLILNFLWNPILYWIVYCIFLHQRIPFVYFFMDKDNIKLLFNNSLVKLGFWGLVYNFLQGPT